MFQCTHDVARLRLEHEDDTVGADVGVGPVQHEEVREAGNRHAEVGICSLAPGFAQRGAAFADHVNLAQIVGGGIPGGAQHDIDVELGARSDRAGLDTTSTCGWVSVCR